MSRTNGQISSLVLESAWQRYAEFDTNGTEAARQRTSLRRAAIALAFVAVLLAVFLNTYSIVLPQASGLIAGIAELLRIGLILVLIINFIILALAIRFQQQAGFQELRAAAEEIKKEIYLYRTVLIWHSECDQWLLQRITDIQRHIADGFGSDITLKPYHGSLPPHYNPNDPNSDPGFIRLLPDDYLRYRLENQLNYYSTQIIHPQKSRFYLHLGLFVTGGLSLLLAAIPSADFSAWVAVAVFAAAALINWLEPRQLDTAITGYNQLIASLNIVKDRWHSLSKAEQTGEEFFKLVTTTERIIWSEHNKHASEMWRAIDELQGQTNDALDEVALLTPMASLTSTNSTDSKILAKTGASESAESAPNGTQESVVEEESPQTIVETMEEQKSSARLPKGLPHAFVVMPFGRKQGPDGRWYDFDAIYNDLIRSALETAGFESFRADEESVSGDILTDMFQELLLADLVIADLSIDNANVFYELGVRHALRKRGLVHIQSGRSYMPFDIFNVRTIPYHTDKNGRPDPEHLEKDKQAITKITRETWASDLDRVHSPIFNLLDGLPEPDRKTLRTPLATGFWREYNEWKERVTIAQRQKRLGDILLLTEEISNPLIKEEAIGEAGRALRSMGRHELALEQYRRGLEINPRNAAFRREEAFHLNRLNRTDEAIVKLERLLKDHPNDTEAISFLGRIFKQIWMETWVNKRTAKKRIKEATEASHWLVKSVNTYLESYRLNQNDYYPGINALTGSVIMDYLARYNGLDDDPDVEAIREDLPKIKGAIHFALESTTQKNQFDYWALVSLAELKVSIADDPQRVTRAYKRALTAARKNVYNLKTSLGQLELLKSLGFRPEFVKAGIDVLHGEINRIKLEEDTEEPGATEDPPQVFLFAGHRLDLPGQRTPRFPAGMEKEVRERINKCLDKFNAGDNDLAITAGAAAGGDIIFLEVCLERGLKVEIYLPFEEGAYLQGNVSYAADQWIERFYALRNNPDVTIRLQPDHLGPIKSGSNVYERNERWALYSALIHGIDRTRAIILWDGVMSDTAGGPDSMIERVRHIGGIAEHLNTTKFDYWKAEGKVSKALDILTQDL